ncbi:MAG: hypothetical protein HOP28_16595 [Gemmatimonadales bacterium]|nr:hypothetical protein [Gemmatimonadales bacterium]
MAALDSIGPKGIGARFLFAVILVFATFNPWGASFYHWTVEPLFAAGGGIGTVGPVKVLVALLLLIGWIVCLQTTKRSIGWKGALLVAAVFGTLVWLLIDRHLLSAGSSRTIALIVLIIVSAILAIGMSWSHLARKISGQIDTDQVA